MVWSGLVGVKCVCDSVVPSVALGVTVLRVGVLYSIGVFVKGKRGLLTTTWDVLSF